MIDVFHAAFDSLLDLFNNPMPLLQVFNAQSQVEFHKLVATGVPGTQFIDSHDPRVGEDDPANLLKAVLIERGIEQHPNGVEKNRKSGPTNK